MLIFTLKWGLSYKALYLSFHRWSGEESSKNPNKYLFGIFKEAASTPNSFKSGPQIWLLSATVLNKLFWKNIRNYQEFIIIITKWRQVKKYLNTSNLLIPWLKNIILLVEDSIKEVNKFLLEENLNWVQFQKILKSPRI